MLGAFLQAQLDATDFLNDKPLEAARIVAQASGLPQEVVYLYNGPGGTSFDTTLKPSLVEALKSDVPYLKSIGDFADLDVSGFVQDGPLRTVFGARGLNYDAARTATANPSALRGDPALASELWLDGSDATQTVADPTACCGRSGTRPPAAPRSAPPMFPTPSWAPAGSPTRRSGCSDGQNYLPFGTAGRRASLPRRAPGRRRRELPAGPWRFGMTAHLTGDPVARRPAVVDTVAAAVTAAPCRLAVAVGGCCGWRRLPPRSGCGRCSPPTRSGCWLRFDTLPTVTEIVHALARRLGTSRLLA